MRCLVGKLALHKSSHVMPAGTSIRSFVTTIGCGDVLGGNAGGSFAELKGKCGQLMSPTELLGGGPGGPGAPASVQLVDEKRAAACGATCSLLITTVDGCGVCSGLLIQGGGVG